MQKRQNGRYTSSFLPYQHLMLNDPVAFLIFFRKEQV